MIAKSFPKEVQMRKNARKIPMAGRVIAALLLAAAASLGPALHAASPRSTPSPKPALSHSFFFVGGAYVGNPSSPTMHGQMFVEKLTPPGPHRKYPLVLIHGGAQTATNWMGTPDGREGWAQFLCSHGYVVYMVDQPARGRSAWDEKIDGPLQSLDAITVEKLFTATEYYHLWPQAKLHTQWPGAGSHRGRVGDPDFDQFYASQVPYLASDAVTQRLSQAAGAALLDKIGPAILITHSDSGPIGWLIADARPKLVRAIIALEPADPPFHNPGLPPFTTLFGGKGKLRPWAITDIPITYDHPVSATTPLPGEQESQAQGPNLAACWRQKQPAYSLVNLRNLPVMVVTSEASYHSMYDHCTAQFLDAAGVKAEHVKLENKGLRGNAHMMMLEKNNLQIAELIITWLTSHIDERATGNR
jgi:pimeloyl-ACP methyl ester carboxylesterase